MLCLQNMYKFCLDMVGYLHYAVWKLIQATGWREESCNLVVLVNAYILGAGCAYLVVW